MSRTTQNGAAAVAVEYKITDGGVFDQDGTVNGNIQDPVGIANQVVGVPNTGLKEIY